MPYESEHGDNGISKRFKHTNGVVYEGHERRFRLFQCGNNIYSPVIFEEISNNALATFHSRQQIIDNKNDCDNGGSDQYDRREYGCQHRSKSYSCNFPGYKSGSNKTNNRQEAADHTHDGENNFTKMGQPVFDEILISNEKVRKPIHQVFQYRHKSDGNLKFDTIKTFPQRSQRIVVGCKLIGLVLRHNTKRLSLVLQRRYFFARHG